MRAFYFVIFQGGDSVMAKVNRPRGTADVLPQEVQAWRFLEETARGVCAHFHVQEIRTPVFEHTELFLRGVGETTDVVEKEMYTFLDKGGRRLSLRPEGTAAVARAVLENKLYAQELPVKVFYLAPMFRYERPGQGRLRQHHQFGVELVGSESALADVEAIALAMRFYEQVGATGVTAVINSVGCEGCRPVYREEMLGYVRPRLERMCGDCRRRAEKNPLRILDCKQERCQAELIGAPSIQGCLCEGCKRHFSQLVQGLEALGVSYEVDTSLVRGLDYYTRTVVEFMVGEPGRRVTISGGGRYNGLYQELGGQELPAVGFGIGLERVMLLLQELGVLGKEQVKGPELYVLPLGERAQMAVLPMVDTWRRAGVAVELDLVGSGMKSGLKRANRLGAEYAVIVGEEELEAGRVLVKDLATGEQERLLAEELLYRLGR
jgi:histidyl-tRNA synthetase